jgi:DnaJ like chaperone protein
MSLGKWLGMGAGWILLGPIGALFGFIFGSVFDGMQDAGVQQGAQTTQKGDFIFSLLILTASVMKADGRVLKSELNYVKKFFVGNFGESQAKDYIATLGKIIKEEFDVREIADQIHQYMDHASRTQLLQFLFEVAKSDGYVHPKEVELIKEISQHLGIRPAEYESIKAMFYEEVEQSYRILEVAGDATDDEVRDAYRKKVKENHPDKVAHLGEEIQRAANEKLKKINDAYEKIKRERGMV